MIRRHPNRLKARRPINAELLEKIRTKLIVARLERNPVVDYDAWYRERQQRAHDEFMRRTSRLPACLPRDITPSTEPKPFVVKHLNRRRV